MLHLVVFVTRKDRRVYKTVHKTNGQSRDYHKPICKVRSSIHRMNIKLTSISCPSTEKVSYTDEEGVEMIGEIIRGSFILTEDFNIRAVDTAPPKKKSSNGPEYGPFLSVYFDFWKTFLTRPNLSIICTLNWT